MFVVKSWQIFYGIWYVPLKYNTSYFAFSMFAVLIIDKCLWIGALQCLVPWKICLLAHFPWQMLQFGNSIEVHPLQLTNACFRRMDIIAIASSQHCQTCSLTFQVCLLSLQSSPPTWKVKEHVLHKVLLCSNLETLIYEYCSLTNVCCKITTNFLWDMLCSTEVEHVLLGCLW